MMQSADKKLLVPVLDRLMDQASINAQPHQLLKQLRESVRRDLEILFNTRFRCVSPPDGCNHLKSSLVNFGLPDLSTINLAAQEQRKRFCRDIEKAILTFEPRIKTVKVQSDSKIDPENPFITFRIEAVLHTNPAPELIIFDSALDLIKQSVDISEIQ
ncbi:type VI secretion system baseplate subunit TssE [Simiduia agarivorans]|uniref:IraD/Gp25-like domain-containing protein n=1 Tax=Simiduia agarivorans (strain DSM 21679 / JCM 13881 / BCRC 17597 / SA1) TaxID=1117647 RepID=K4KVY6_SIMAS|nr:type VI secretion system baseplate subunit TssE [Simiduia agarivorans]AFU98097.1 hypothetical protein M5M_04450 [Simiduia agarivorans SA1 = DSM 21679]